MHVITKVLFPVSFPTVVQLTRMEVQAWFVVFASKHERFHGPSAQDGIYRKHHGGGAIPNIPLGS